MNKVEVNRIFESMLRMREGISDLNFSVGRPPQVEVSGELVSVPIKGMERLSPYQTEMIALSLMGQDQETMRKLVHTGSTDLSYSIPGVTRFRVNVFLQRGTFAIVMRVIPSGVPSIAQMGLPKALYAVAEEKNGIVLVTGPTGSGKSTTLAAIINDINEKHAYHIVTIEDPIEYLHQHKKSTVNQRELGTDTTTFSLALRAALRQAPKVVLVGEMRDAETTEIALEAAETGHLVLSTLHTIDASKTIARIIGIFPTNEEQQIRTRFAQTFKWVISQRLVPKRGGGRVAAIEILRSTLRTREYIVRGESEGRSLVDAMNDGHLDGMQAFDSELERMVQAGIIEEQVALSYATNPGNLALAFQGLGSDAAIDQLAPGAEVEQPPPSPAPAPAASPPPKARTGPGPTRVENKPDWLE
ncbi:MAG: PilT/PilU family type 4a pilus ATPase [Acidobacteriota bacterium]